MLNQSRTLILVMIIFAIVVRDKNILAEYGTSAQNLSEQMLSIVSRSTASGTRLVPIGQYLCAVMNKTINMETISFAAIIESNEERDNSFNFLDSLSAFFEKEAKNSKMTTEMNSFLSKAIKNQMEKTNSRFNAKDKLDKMHSSIGRTTEIAKDSINQLMENRVKLDDLEGRSGDLKNSVYFFSN